MIKADQLKEFKRRKGFEINSSDSSLNQIGAIIQEKSDARGLPLGTAMDRIKSGGLFNRNIVDCLVIYNKHHPHEYFRIIITLKKQGNTNFVEFFYYGYSKNEVNETKVEERRSSLSGKLLNAITEKKHTAKYDEEKFYYSSLGDIFDELHDFYFLMNDMFDGILN